MAPKDTSDPIHPPLAGDPPLAGETKSIPVASMVESIVGCKWSIRLLRTLAEGHSRPSALLRACPGLSAKVLNERLRKMMRFGIVQRTVFGEKPPFEVQYLLTPFGRCFMGILEEIRSLQEAVDRGEFEDPGNRLEEGTEQAINHEASR